METYDKIDADISDKKLKKLVIPKKHLKSNMTNESSTPIAMDREKNLLL
jgi:hypothetical protein